MSITTDTLTSRVEAMYLEAPGDPEFQLLLAAFDSASDADLAELIEVDGRTRLRLGRRVELQRYLSSIPGLHSHEMALDAAIDVALRQLSGSSRPTRKAVQLLCEQHPTFSAAIEEAALLAEAVVSTTGVSRLVRKAPLRDVPCDFGPTIEGGERRYRLVKHLGSGSAGEVYLGQDRRLSDADKPALVAIKVLSSHGRGTRARQQLIEEASKARRVQHDNVVRVLDRGVSDENEDYIVYEHIEAGTLEEWFEQRHRHVTPQQAATLVAGIARGVHAAHAAGLLHCDLKPSNVLMTFDGTPKVADFGIAVRESELRSMSAAGQRPIGNIAFISPEQYLGREGSLSVASDVYALGGILFYLVTGHLPNGSTVEEVAATNDPVHGRRVPPVPAGRGVDEDLVAVCTRAMSVPPLQRQASASALADDLACWLNHEPIAWTGPSLWKMSRLAAVRKPVLAAGLLITLLSLMGGTAAGGYYAMVAGTRETELTLLRNRMSTAQSQLGGVLDALKNLQGGRIDQDLIPMSVALDGLSGDLLLGSPEARERLWRERRATVQWIIDEYSKAGRSRGVETLMWEGVLGLWLLNDKKFAEAEAVLVPSAAKWSELNLADDPLAVQVRRLAACAQVQRMSQQSRGQPLTVEDIGQLQQAEPVLEAGLRAGPPGGYPSRLHTLQAMAVLYEPALLDKPGALQAARGKLKHYLDWQKTQKKLVPKQAVEPKE